MRFLSFIYGVICYLIFFATFLYAVGFVGNFIVPKSMDSGVSDTWAGSLIVNLILLSIFAIQHSVMARKSFKQKWTQIIPKEIERSTYVLASSLALIILFWQWRPMGSVIWDVSGTFIGSIMVMISLLGWLFVLASTFMIDHFELFGLKQVYYNFLNKQLPEHQFKQPGFYKYLRHPIYFGFTVAFWATPVMTTAHLVFAIATLGYILIGIFLEEKDLNSLFGDEYRRYKSQVPMLMPLKIGKKI